MQCGGQCAPGERGGVDPVDRRIAVQHRIQVGRDVATAGCAAGIAACHPVCGHPVGAEPGRDIGARQRGELTDGADSQAPQQIHQFRAARTGQARLGGQRPDGQPRQELRIPARRHHPAGLGGDDGGGQLVGDTRLAFGAGRGHRIDKPFGRGVLGTEVAGRTAHRQHQQSGPQHLGAGHHLVHRRGDGFEEPRVAGRVGGDDVHLRAARLRLTAPQTAPHPGVAGRRGAGHHPVGEGDCHRGGGRQSGRGRGGHRRPVHAPDRQHPAAPGGPPGGPPGGHRAATLTRTPLMRPP